MSALRILLLEDSSHDAELIQELLEGDYRTCQIDLVQSRAEFLAALKNPEIELILADYKLPSFDGLSALKLALSFRPELPFIFVSGTLGEELAIEALKIGATDYVLKTRLSRLVPSVERALRETKERVERKKAEEALRRSEMYLAEAQRLSHTGSFGWNVTSGEIYWSEETYRIYALDPAIKPTVEMVINRTHQDDRARLRQILDRASADRCAFTAEHRLVLPDDSVKYVRAVAHGVTGDNPDSFLFVGALTDVTERKLTEETLREQASLLNLTHDAIFVCDMNRVITYWSRGAEALYQWSAEEAKGKLAPELLKTIFPVPFERIKAELRSSDQWEGELVRTRKDGTQIPVASRWTLQRNARGVPVAALESSNDITHRKRAEIERERLRQLETDLAHINRVSMMGELAASLAHEIKQPMAAAVTSAGACMRWLGRDAPDLSEARNCASAMVEAVMRATGIIDGIRSLYRRSTPERELLDLNEIIQEMAVLLRDTADRRSVSIRTELDTGLPRTTAHRVQLQQVLMNLMLNGIEAMQDTGGELIVTSKRIEHRQLLVSVSDSGIGLPTDEPERIFEAFFTTKPKGTGMGLSISRRIIEAHDGRLSASPKTGRGAKFQFTLPGEETRPESVALL
ncbi:hybrid sensor histidine kinase/response regulator [Pararobbsia alpina]|uniref:histidine kinase n=1 Tax=Pararobbsia alpina TaxID=621374 RepID=A0A6S7BGQ5_9BURK|nr:hybrid sensor histidine kinase/response regulator [Pararobbsia alpina]CAB3787956.1 Adaptive-response sensory-kinase SasA [Pararobbsia alpina]